MKQSFDQCLQHPIIPGGGGTSALFSYILDSFRDYATKCLQLNNQLETQAGNSSQDNNHLIWAESISEFFGRCLLLISHTIYITLIFDSGPTFLSVLCLGEQRKTNFKYKRHLVKL